jgi:hypothetical protein
VSGPSEGGPMCKRFPSARRSSVAERRLESCAKWALKAPLENWWAGLEVLGLLLRPVHTEGFNGDVRTACRTANWGVLRNSTRGMRLCLEEVGSLRREITHAGRSTACVMWVERNRPLNHQESLTIDGAAPVDRDGMVKLSGGDNGLMPPHPADLPTR